jgi:hypothetical protein
MEQYALPSGSAEIRGRAFRWTRTDLGVGARRRAAFHYIRRSSDGFSRVCTGGVSVHGNKTERDMAELEFASYAKELRRKHLRRVARALQYSPRTACAGSNRVMLQPHALMSRKGQTHPKGGGAKLPV